MIDGRFVWLCLRIFTANMSTTKLIPTEHKDIIHDVSFDFYGKRMATCSSDHTVKVNDVLFVILNFSSYYSSSNR